MTSVVRSLRLGARTERHAIGVIDDLVIAYVFRGSEEDPSHITAIVDAARVAAARIKRKVRLLVVIQDAMTSAPPSTGVRAAIRKASDLFEDAVAELMVVTVGQGFGVAIHRAVVSTLVTLARPSVPFRVVADVGTALRELLGSGQACDEVLRMCEADLARQTQPLAL